MNIPIKSAEIRREELQAHAKQIGIDEAYISTLVETFYGRIQLDPTLGPIFEQAVAGNWSPHLATMKSFWSSVALNSGKYAGKPVPAHKKHSQIQPEHFAIWLELFHKTLLDTAPSPEAVEHFMERAERIARSLKLALFGLPSLESGLG